MRSYLLPEGGTEQTSTAPESCGNAFVVPGIETDYWVGSRADPKTQFYELALPKDGLFTTFAK